MIGRTLRWQFYPLALMLAPALYAAPREVSFTQSAPAVEAYDFVEITALITSPDAPNPFTGATLTGSFAKAGASQRWNVEGFCDSTDGSMFRIRFMPSSPGDYSYSIAYRQGGFEKAHTGHVPRHRRPSSRSPPGRPQVSLAFHLGRHRRALLLQRHHRVLADGLARGADDQLLHRAPCTSSRSTGSACCWPARPTSSGANPS